MDCVKGIEIPDEDRKWMTKFFSDLLFEEQGVFTLFEDKPMVMSLLYNYTREEFESFYDTLPDSIKKETQLVEYDYAENWNKWENIQNRFSIGKYLFEKRAISEDGKIFCGLFINIAETAMALQENYEDFRRIVGFDFHPFKEVFKIGDKDSVFWNNVFKNHALLGILLGYGKRNSYLFHWMTEENSKKEELLIEQSILSETSDQAPLYGTASLDNFSLPIFRYDSSKENERLLSKYKLQRDRIKTRFKGKDILDVTLRQLTSVDSPNGQK